VNLCIDFFTGFIYSKDKGNPFDSLNEPGVRKRRFGLPTWKAVKENDCMSRKYAETREEESDTCRLNDLRDSIA
jgi:hypothetical protein